MYRILYGSAAVLFTAVSFAATADGGVPARADAEHCLGASARTESVLEDRLMGRIHGAADRDTASFQAELSDRQLQYGAFDLRLLDTLLALGMRARTEGKYAESADAFRRALYVVRSNEGPYSLDQLPILDLLIDASSRVSDWYGVESAYETLHWLYRRNYAAADPRQLRGLKRLLRWHIEAYNKKTRTSLLIHESRAEALYRQAAAIITACTGDPDLAACLLGGRTGCDDRNGLNFNRQGQSN